MLTGRTGELIRVDLSIMDAGGAGVRRDRAGAMIPTGRDCSWSTPGVSLLTWGETPGDQTVD